MRLLTKQLRFPPGHPKAGKLCKRLMVCVGPQHGKSTIVSQLFPACAMAYNPAIKLILLSYSADLAAAHSQVARDRVLEFGAHLCPNGSLELKKDAKARNAWYTNHGGYMRAASIQGSVTRLAADGVIIDDPFKGSEDSSSPTIKDRVWTTYTSVAETRLAPDGWVALVGTPWSIDDLRGRLLETEADDWIVLRFPALAEENDVLGRAPGEPLFPERYSDGWYEQTRDKFEQRGLSYLWDALYQCNPTGDGSLRAFPDDYFGPWLWVDELPIGHRNPEQFRVLALDPSKSKTGASSSDFAAFCDMTLLSDRHLYATMHLEREPLPALYARAVAIVGNAKREGRPFHRLICEATMFQEAVGLAIQEHLRAAGLDIPIDLHQTPSDQSKHARIQVSLAPFLAQKRLHFVGQTRANKLTVQQTRELPNGSHDDGPDAVELATQALNVLLTGTKRPQQQKVLRI
ncbi:hypothetical protein J8F10_14355 [Gemmata sp. G18]|uniref:Terminase large subunit gp17-like C-terminal domain-containing protein n=1 Tax=Gemmata palustris TaxID=2822762 RepID=A0ABS5BRV1_9BACT|nr:hypothetical protein [Gemmata palustris]MBP3956459.1 hypothetical protein [Gemmata palustris]